MKISRSFLAVLLCALVSSLVCVRQDAALVAQSPSGNRTTPGELVIDPPTLINLGFEWFIQGDDNRTASVAAAYRKQGAAQWSTGLPLLRLQGERISGNERMDVISPNMFAGSILDLEPNTPYEVRLTLSDPDGVSGEAVKNVRVRTRPEPMPHAGGRVFHVYPPGFTGTKLEPSFEGLMCAYNLTCAGTDWATAGRPRVKAGDTILVHAGLYKYNRYEYTNNPAVNRTQPLDGTYYLTADGTPEMPIAIKAAGDGEAIFDGNGNFAVFDIRAGDYTYIEGLTIRNTEYGILAGTQFLLGAKGLTVKRTHFEQVGSGIFTNWSGSNNFYIADNTFIGRNDPDHVIGWSGEFWAPFNDVEGQKFPPPMASYVAIKLYGPGHVVAYNYVANFHDGVNVEVYGNPDGSAAMDGPKYPPREYFDRRPVAIDFYNNYMTNFHDNPFETDGGMHNIRVMRNMMINSASHAFCNQPAVGGPVYWIRNIAYNLPGGSSRLTGGSAGVLLYNNTILSETQASGTSNAHWRNNLFLGQNTAPAIFSVTTYTNYTSSDYNGFRPNPGAATAFQWNSPPAAVSADFSAMGGGNAPGASAQPNAGRAGAPPARGEGRGNAPAAAVGGRGGGAASGLEQRQFPTLTAYSQATNQDRNSVLVDYDIFMNVPKLDREDRSTVQRIYKAEAFDFRLKPGSAAVDRGTPLAGITEGFAGNAPDLGAIELGQGPPHYGPRPR
jgi:hypothetical protein